MVCTGPLTNLAAAIDRDPALVGRIDRLVLIGGAFGTDPLLPAVETNVGCDPAAAARVLGAGIADVVLIGIDATFDTALDEDDAAALESWDTVPARLAARLLRDRLDRCERLPVMRGRRAAPLHDALAVGFLLDPDVVTLTPGRVDVDGDGRTSLQSGSSVRVALGADVARLRTILRSTLGR